MGINVDRGNNVIVNQRGVAHRTGWVVIRVVKDFETMKPAGHALVRGRGAYAGGMYRTNTQGLSVRLEGALTLETFVAATGWTPEGV